MGKDQARNNFEGTTFRDQDDAFMFNTVLPNSEVTAAHFLAVLISRFVGTYSSNRRN